MTTSEGIRKPHSRHVFTDWAEDECGMWWRRCTIAGCRQFEYTPKPDLSQDGEGA